MMTFTTRTLGSARFHCAARGILPRAGCRSNLFPTVFGKMPNTARKMRALPNRFRNDG